MLLRINNLIFKSSSIRYIFGSLFRSPFFNHLHLLYYVASFPQSVIPVYLVWICDVLEVNISSLPKIFLQCKKGILDFLVPLKDRKFENSTESLIADQGTFNKERPFQVQKHASEHYASVDAHTECYS